MSEKFWIVLPQLPKVITLLDDGTSHIRDEVPTVLRYGVKSNALDAATKEVKATGKSFILMEAIAIIEPEEKPVKVREL